MKEENDNTKEVPFTPIILANLPQSACFDRSWIRLKEKPNDENEKDDEQSKSSLK